MRRKKDAQIWFEYQPSNLKLTNEYFARYETISELLDETPRLLDLVHRDLEAALEQENRESMRRGGFTYTSEMVLRLVICQVLEGASLRGVVVRVDDSHCLRRFTRIYEGPMMGHTALCRLRNAIRPETWKSMNEALARAAFKRELITGDRLRIDTTAVETNVHWPTDSSLLWDIYRTLGTLIGKARVIDSKAVGIRRVHLTRVKKVATTIARKAQHKGRKSKDLKPLYEQLIGWVGGICDWSIEVTNRLTLKLAGARVSLPEGETMKLLNELRHVEGLGRRVIWQASERVLHGRPVPNEGKLFSVFEEHTELLKRGKAGKDIEFGHMIQIQQTGEKFITEYEVFDKKPAEPTLVSAALKNHKRLFGEFPMIIAADKGYWSGDEFEKIPHEVEVIAIPKKGRRNDAEQAREVDPLFRLAQAFRAGVEGSISFLKRCLRLTRCMNKGWKQYCSTVGATVVAHNLLILARC